MSSLTSVGGMIPLVLLPGADQNLSWARQLSSEDCWVHGFTLILVPSVLSVFFTAVKPKRNQLNSRGFAWKHHLPLGVFQYLRVARL